MSAVSPGCATWPWATKHVSPPGTARCLHAPRPRRWRNGDGGGFEGFVGVASASKQSVETLLSLRVRCGTWQCGLSTGSRTGLPFNGKRVSRLPVRRVLLCPQWYRRCGNTSRGTHFTFQHERCDSPNQGSESRNWLPPILMALGPSAPSVAFTAHARPLEARSFAASQRG
jgi:hypothetical protein